MRNNKISHLLDNGRICLLLWLECWNAWLLVVFVEQEGHLRYRYKIHLPHVASATKNVNGKPLKQYIIKGKRKSSNPSRNVEYVAMYLFCYWASWKNIPVFLQSQMYAFIMGGSIVVWQSCIDSAGPQQFSEAVEHGITNE